MRRDASEAWGRFSAVHGHFVPFSTSSSAAVGHCPVGACGTADYFARERLRPDLMGGAITDALKLAFTRAHALCISHGASDY
jgi:hypothetical protein